MRTYYPDVDISADLIRETIAKDEQISANLRAHDIYFGNMIDVLSFSYQKKAVAYVAFPMGETGCQLSEWFIS